MWDCKGLVKQDGITLVDFLDFPEILPLNIIARQHVESIVNKWQQKDEFETTADWQARVTEATRKEKAEAVYSDMVEKYVLNAAAKSRLKPVLGMYDADHRTFLVSDSLWGQIIVSLNGIVDARTFKEKWDSVIAIPTYYFNTNTTKLDIQEILFYLDNKVVARYGNGNTQKYQITDIDYNFDPIDIPMGKDIAVRIPKVVDTVIVRTNSDVDINIPLIQTTNNNTYAFIIANENYHGSIPNVPFALNDGRSFKRYCRDRLGIDDAHIEIFENATYGQIIACIESIKDASRANDGHLKVLFYYAGHAFPDENNLGAFILPVDGVSRLSATGYSLDELYNELGTINAESIVCFIDACFSGSTRDDQMLFAESRGVAIKPKESLPIGHLVVLTSSSNSETSHQYYDGQHGLFTYYLLKYMQTKKGTLKLGDLAEYVIRNVKRTSYDVNHKIQTPKVISALGLAGKWEEITL